FYWRPGTASATERLQSTLKWYNRAVPAVTSYNNVIQLQRDPANNTDFLPAYRINGLKLERDHFGLSEDLNSNATLDVGEDVNGNGVLDTAPRDFGPVQVDVEALIFAQDGSWFVIPQPVMARLDLDGDGTASVVECEAFLDEAQRRAASDVADTNGDGTISAGETATYTTELQARAIPRATHYRRLNYQITVTGTIAQNYAPTATVDFDTTANPDGDTRGAVAMWLDAQSYPERIMDNGGGFSRGANWQTIQYLVDPVTAGTELKLPMTPQLEFVS
ncbi:MAG: hypothetical protein M3347_15675, partial [Armatimonadota bacterium]|nr:hypothetical protein [Armatimonadota bacterium]